METLSDEQENLEKEVKPDSHCAFFVTKKKRYCRMCVRPGSSYCAEHEPRDSSMNGARVPCPLDPKHTCYWNKLEKHLSVCNARPAPAPHLRPGVNAGADGAGVGSGERRAPLTTAPPDKLAAVLTKIDALYASVMEEGISSWQKDEEVHPAVRAELMRAELGPNARRQLRQVGALLRLVEREGLVRPHTCYVELGAGRGRLAYYAADAWCATGDGRLLLVDRAAYRHKRENKLPAGHATRLRVDLADLVLDEAAARDADGARAPERVVGLAKHLCGAATDYALRCVTAARAARGLLLATCCHHRCERGSFVGADVLRARGLLADDLDLVLGVVSWATCGDGRPRADPASSAEARVAREARAAAGRRAKTVVDWARVLHLRALGWHARLAYFVPPDVTPENICIVAMYAPTPAPPPATTAPRP